MDTTQIDESTISRFGDQWQYFTENTGYYFSFDCLTDICGPLLDTANFQGKNICDLGSGTGRIVNMLLHAGANHVTAVEPSDSFHILKKNTEPFKTQITLVHDTIESLKNENQYDYVVSFGVIHHITDPNLALCTIKKILKPGGKCVIWLYGYEGNELYLKIITPIRKITTRLSLPLLLRICRLLTIGINLYEKLCRFLPLPMKNYFQNHIAKLNEQRRTMTIYDQLNPTYAKYYKKQEVLDLFNKHEFKNIQMYHRHGYSWTVVAEKT